MQMSGHYRSCGVLHPHLLLQGDAQPVPEPADAGDRVDGEGDNDVPSSLAERSPSSDSVPSSVSPRAAVRRAPSNPDAGSAAIAARAVGALNFGQVVAIASAAAAAAHAAGSSNQSQPQSQSSNGSGPLLWLL